MKTKTPSKEEEQKEPEIETVDDSQEPGVTVELEKEKIDEVPEWKKELDSLKIENEKYKARVEFQARQFEKAQKEFQEASKRIPNYPTNVSEKDKDDDNEYDQNIDAIAKDNYQKAVRILARKEAEGIAEKKFEELLKKQQDVYSNQNIQLKRQQTLEKSKQEVMEEHPELLDESSSKSKIYVQVISEDQDLLSDPYGPIVAMKRMEKRLKTLGVSDKNQELDRFKRAAASSAPKGTTSGSKSVTLTREQEQLCKENGWSVEKYAKSLRALETGGVTV